MKAKHRFIVAVIVLGLLMTGPFVVTSLLVWLDLKDTERDMLTQLLLSRLPVGTIMTLFGFAVGVGVLHKLFKQYVEGLLRMSETLRMMLGANRNFRVTVEGPPEVQQLAQAANDLAQQRDALMDDVDAQIATAKASVEEEKNRLAALMSELAQAVVVCNLDGRILLYNNRARLQFKALSQGPTSVAGGALIGLGRSIFRFWKRARSNMPKRLSVSACQPEKRLSPISSRRRVVASCCVPRWCLSWLPPVRRQMRPCPATCSRSKTSPAA